MDESLVYTVSMAAPDDVSGIAALFDDGTLAPRDVRGVIAQTEGDGFARGYFTLALELLLSERLGVPRAQITEKIPIMAIGGTAGLMTPHATLFVRRPAADPVPQHDTALALGFAFTRTLKEAELGTALQARVVAESVAAAMADAGIESHDDVAAVEIKCPQPSPESLPGVGAGALGARSRGACALGAAIALGEVDAGDVSDDAICARTDLYARRASASSGGELHNVRIVVVGNRRGAPGRQRAGWGVMSDQLDTAGALQAFEMAGLAPENGALDAAASARLGAVFVNAGADAVGQCRDHRHTLNTDLLAAYSGHVAKAVAHATVSAIAQTPLVLGNAGSEHQGPLGGNLVCVIADQAPAGD
ncbi:MAG: ring-opening amidohydrolase [Alphaproteobacteria bacterium]|nr:ring-opening amidohydrolase [Alphaproteobacteria bacterium]